ncbi:hypothetical protein GCM10008179_33760 [Hansschlegelia plantiphila]|uniref:Uncharacterized protein n=1 Tax=Hansschlegelia plantiphila TaxID=374655 RepID=A0A9W6J4S4_9HYPH|nr:hypothetical protein GCM10008179_33760 [Hansschlegelia plantiphila]
MVFPAPRYPVSTVTGIAEYAINNPQRAEMRKSERYVTAKFGVDNLKNGGIRSVDGVKARVPDGMAVK